MQQNSAVILRECADELLEFVELCSSKKEIDFHNTHVKTLSEELKRGGSLNIIVCGHAKSGKSTLLNYLLSSDAKDMKGDSRHVLLSGEDVETSTPWIIQDTLDLPPDKVSVDHVDYKGDVGGHRVFDTIPELYEHLKQTYSRAIIEEILKRDQRHPYSHIHVSSGRPNTKLNQQLFSSAVTIIDTQDLEEQGVDTMIKTMKPPSVLICCLDASKDFHRSEICTFFKSFVKNLTETYLVFVCTHVETKLRDMQQIGCGSGSNGSDINYDALLTKVEAEIVNPLKEEFFKNSLEVFFFDPTSKYEPIRSGAYKLQERLIALRKELNVDFYFHHEMKELLQKEVVAIQDELYILSGKQLKIDIDSSNESRKNKAKERFQDLSKKLAATFSSKLESSLQQELIKLAQERKDVFMKGKPFIKTLQERMLNWLLKDGLKVAISSLLKDQLLEFFKSNENEIQCLFETNTLDTNVHGLTSNGPLTLGFFVSLIQIIFNVASIFSDEEVDSEDIGHSLSTCTHLLGMKDRFKHADFETHGLDFVSKVIRKVLSEKSLDPNCSKIADACIGELEKGTKIDRKDFTTGMLTYIKDAYDIDYEQLDVIQKRLAKIK